MQRTAMGKATTPSFPQCGSPALIALMVIDGTLDSSPLVAYVEQLRMPTLKPAISWCSKTCRATGRNWVSALIELVEAWVAYHLTIRASTRWNSPSKN
jgi:hypothetical protein